MNDAEFTEMRQKFDEACRIKTAIKNITDDLGSIAGLKDVPIELVLRFSRVGTLTLVSTRHCAEGLQDAIKTEMQKALVRYEELYASL